VTVRRVSDQQLAAVLYPTSAGSHADAAAVSALGEILGSSPNGRLYKKLVESKKAVSVGEITFQLAEPGYAMFVGIMSKDQNVADVKASLIETVEGLAQEPVTEAELKR
jgi:zinc protease